MLLSFKQNREKYRNWNSGPGSSVGIASDYGLDGPWIEYQRLRWSRGLHAGLWYPRSRVRSRPKPSDFFRLGKFTAFGRGSKIICPMLVTRTTKGQKGQKRSRRSKRSTMAQKKYRWGRNFSHMSRPALWPTQPPAQCVPGLSRGQSGRGVVLTTYPS
jgi:hypothetical protein